MADLSTSIRSKKFGQNSLALVTDVVTNEEHDEYGKTGIFVGKIWFKYVDWAGHTTSKKTSLTAMPLESELQSYPLIGEMVFIQTVQGRRFYTRRVNISKRLQYSNSVLKQDKLTFDKTEQNTSEAIQQARAPGGGQLYNSNHPTSFQTLTNENYEPLGDDELHNLKHFDGDVILQNRYGATLRFGSSQSEYALNQQVNKVTRHFVEAVRTDNVSINVLGPTKPLSDDPLLSNNDPIIVMRVGQHENAEITSKYALGARAQTMEDINRDDSSFVLSTNQQINFRFSTIEQPHGFENIYFRSTQRVQGTPGLLADITEPDGLKKAALVGNQSLLNSDRLVFNAKTEDVIFSTSRDFISLTNKDTILDTGNDFVIGAKQIYLLNNSTDLGTVDKSQKDRYDQVALAGEVVRVITELIDALTASGAYTGGGPAPIMPTGLLGKKGQIMKNINKIRSYLVRIEK